MTILIRPTEQYDYLEYRNDQNIWENLKDAHMYSSDHSRKWLANLNSRSLRFSILLDKKPVLGDTLKVTTYSKDCKIFAGLIRIDDIDETNRNCMIGMDLLPEFQGVGIANKSYTWLLGYLFNSLNMNALYAEIIEYNEKSLKCLTKTGFKTTGRWPKKIFRKGQYWDCITVALTREEYQNT